MTQTDRLNTAKDIARDAGALGLEFFQDISKLEINEKSTQDLVSNADLEVERFVRARLAEAFPDDGIVGEEHEDVPTKSGWTWVIDPIDGTANFVRGIPQWCVILACVHDNQTKIGVMFEPSYGELFWCGLGQGAFVGERPMHVSQTQSLSDGSVGVGFNGRTPAGMVPALIDELVTQDGIFFRNASGGLMLAYVAAGRLIGYTEPHMNPWDCLAGQLMVAESGGSVEAWDTADMLERGGRVIVGAPGIFEDLLEMSDRHYRDLRSG